MRPLLIFTFVLLSTCIARADLIGEGQYVKDGDTFDLVMPSHKVTIRVCGIDAPESHQPGSKEAWAKLSALVHKKAVRCVQVGQPPGTVCDGRSKPTNRDRIVAQCFVDGVDIATEMVRSGHACSWNKFDGGYYERFGKRCARD